jgi:uncharacterized protein involved in tellurium resistance
MIADPSTAPPRADLPFLSRRSKPRPKPLDPALADFIAGRAIHPGRAARKAAADVAAKAAADAAAKAAADAAAKAAADAAARPVVAPPAPRGVGSGLDLSGPASSSLDLSGPASAAPPPVGSQALADALDLSSGPAAPSSPGPLTPPAAPKARVHNDVRIRAGQQHLMSIKDPTVTLTRVQSGIGQLQIEAVCSPAVGDLRLGAAYQLADGTTSTVQYTGGNRFAPSSRRPVVVAGRDEYEHLRIDLRRSRELERLAVYAFSESRVDLSWGGTLVISTFGGARVDLPLESLFSGKVAVLVSIYNLDGEFVLRAEMETITGDVREAARAYGYDRITWRDDRSPVD